MLKVNLYRLLFIICSAFCLYASQCCLHIHTHIHIYIYIHMIFSNAFTLRCTLNTLNIYSLMILSCLCAACPACIKHSCCLIH